MGDSFSRRILLSAVETGKTVEEISEEQHIPLSTCYRRVREFVDEGLMMLEKIIITQTGKRYAVYRTSFAEVTIRLNTAEITIETSPNAHVREKLRTRWLSANFPAQSPDGLLKIQA